MHAGWRSTAPESHVLNDVYLILNEHPVVCVPEQMVCCNFRNGIGSHCL